MKGKIAVVAALLCAGFAVPALADWDNLGSITVDGGRGNARPGSMMRMDRDVKVFNLGGPVEKLQLRAERSDVACRSVQASFGNGRDRTIFSGTLRENRTTNVDLPGDLRNLRALNFNCAATRGRDATIRIVADIGRYRPDWQRNPDFQRSWARLFNWGSNQFNDWQMVGSERFEGRNDSERAFTRWNNGRHVDAVALKPMGGDARCSRVTARFDRRDQRLSVNNGDLLRQGQYYKVDLPGNYRNLEAIDLRCSPVNSRRVDIQIFTSH